jgi:uncharacterized protein (DUF302 family)
MATVTTRYGIIRELPDMAFDQAKQRVTEALAQEGFGILTEIDVQATMKKKLDADYEPYAILGACNPPLAHRAFQAEEQVGLLLPCNVVVTTRAGGGSVVSAMDPGAMVQVTDNPKLPDVAKEARERLVRALEAV